MRARVVTAGVALVGIGVLSTGVQPATAGRVPFGQSSAVEAGVDQVLTVDDTGEVTLTGPLACPAGEPARITFTLVQEQSDAAGEGAWSGMCVGGGPSRADRTQTWTTPVVASAGTFVPGQGRSGVVFHGTLTAAGETVEWTQHAIRLAG